MMLLAQSSVIFPCKNACKEHPAQRGIIPSASVMSRHLIPSEFQCNSDVWGLNSVSNSLPRVRFAGQRERLSLVSCELGLPAMANSRTQKLFVMRHGERLDDADPTWVAIPGVRTWDPPLTARGTEQAIEVGRKLRSEGVEITRILVSPFLRCVQTTAGFIKGMYPEGTDISKLKVSIEYGLAELMNRFAIRNPRKPQSTEPWHIPFEKLYSILPSGVVDTSVQSIYPKLPEWGESTDDGHKRFSSTFFAVADKFLDENVLCVSHGEGVAVSVMHLRPEVDMYGVHYCAYTLAEREVFIESSEAPPRTGPWKFMTKLGSESGLLYRDKLEE